MMVMERMNQQHRRSRCSRWVASRRRTRQASSTTLWVLSTMMLLFSMVSWNRHDSPLLCYAMTTRRVSFGHSFSMEERERMLIQEQNDNDHDNDDADDMSNIRYLSFGAHSTDYYWGDPYSTMTMEEDDDDDDDDIPRAITYPYRLSPEAQVVAHRLGVGPSLPALCLESIVGKQDSYDVVTVEFSDYFQDSDLAALDLLIYRLQRRFPKAVIVMIQLWSPSHYYHISKAGQIVSFASWRQQQLYAEKSIGWNSTEWKEKISDFEWKYSDRARRAHERVETMVQNRKGELVYFAPPNDPLHALTTSDTWYDETTDLRQQDNSKDLVEQQALPEYILSSKGHLVVANHVRSYVDQEHILQKDLHERNALGDFSSGDRCYLWNSGEHDSKDSKTSISSSQSKNLLKIPMEGLSMLIENTMDEDRVLYVKYPTLPATFQQSQVLFSLDGVTVPIDPRWRQALDSEDGDLLVGNQNFERISAIGKMPAHSSGMLEIIPKEDASQQFSVTSLGFFAKEGTQWQVVNDFDAIVSRKIVFG